jgi:pimeloyl-ACP methyl ester carboxylesterase
MQFVLIHGGWQGGWCWDGVAEELRRKGHEVFAPTMRGSESGQADRAGVTLSEMADRVMRDIADRDLRDVVAVGHSGGGPVIQLLHEAEPARFKRLVFIDAWVLQQGQAIYDILNGELVQSLRAAADASPGRAIPMPKEFWCGALLNDLPAEEASLWFDRTVPCPEGWLTEKVKLPTFAETAVPTSYVFLEQDVTVPKEIYQANAAQLKQPKTTKAPGSHEAMLSRPVELAAAILRVCE